MAPNLKKMSVRRASKIFLLNAKFFMLNLMSGRGERNPLANIKIESRSTIKYIFKKTLAATGYIGQGLFRLLGLSHFLRLFILLQCSFFSINTVVFSMMPEEIFTKYRSSIVFLNIQATDENGVPTEIFGTGFLISENGYVMTTRHLIVADKLSDSVFDDYKIFGSVGSRSETSTRLDLLSEDTHGDLMLLKFEGNKQDYVTVGLCEWPGIREGESIVSLGFPKGSELSIVAGLLSNKSSVGGRWQTDMALTYGFSGAPVFDKYGFVVGIVSGGTEDARGRNFFTPIFRAEGMISNTPTVVQSCRYKSEKCYSSEITLEELEECGR